MKTISTNLTWNFAVEGYDVNSSSLTSRNLTWNPPEIPSNAVIISNKIEGNLNLSLSKGKMSISLNDESLVSNASSATKTFEFDFGNVLTNTLPLYFNIGNKNTSGNFTINCIYTITYELSTLVDNVSDIKIKENGNWQTITKVYKKISNTWVELS